MKLLLVYKKYRKLFAIDDEGNCYESNISDINIYPDKIIWFKKEETIFRGAKYETS